MYRHIVLVLSIIMFLAVSTVSAVAQPYKPVLAGQVIYGYHGSEAIVAVADGYVVGVTGNGPYNSFFVLDTSSAVATMVDLGDVFTVFDIAYDPASNIVYMLLNLSGTGSILVVVDGLRVVDAYAIGSETTYTAIAVSPDSVIIASARVMSEGTRVEVMSLDKAGLVPLASTIYLFPGTSMSLMGVYVEKINPVLVLGDGNNVVFFMPPATIYAYSIGKDTNYLDAGGGKALLVDRNYTAVYLLDGIGSEKSVDVYRYPIGLSEKASTIAGIVAPSYAAVAVSSGSTTGMLTIDMETHIPVYTRYRGSITIKGLAANQSLILYGGGSALSVNQRVIGEEPSPVAAEAVDIHKPVEEPSEPPQLTPLKTSSSPATFERNSVDSFDAVILYLSMIQLSSTIIVYPYDYMLKPFSAEAEEAYMVLHVDDRVYNISFTSGNNSFTASGVPPGDVYADIWMRPRSVEHTYYMGSINITGYDGGFYAARFIRQTPYVINASMEKEKNMVYAIVVNPGKTGWNTVVEAYMGGEKIYSKELSMKPVSRRGVEIPYDRNGTIEIRTYVVIGGEKLLTHIYTLEVFVKTMEGGGQPPVQHGASPSTNNTGSQQATGTIGQGGAGEAASGSAGESGGGFPVLYIGVAIVAVIVAVSLYFFMSRRR